MAIVNAGRQHILLSTYDGGGNSGGVINIAFALYQDGDVHLDSDPFIRPPRKPSQKVRTFASGTIDDGLGKAGCCVGEVTVPFVSMQRPCHRRRSESRIHCPRVERWIAFRFAGDDTALCIETKGDSTSPTHSLLCLARRQWSRKQTFLPFGGLARRLIKDRSPMHVAVW